MSSPIKPFASEAESLQVNDMTVEIRTDRVSVSGSLIVTRDKAGVAHAREMKAILDAVVAALESEKGLPDQVEAKPADTVSDP